MKKSFYIFLPILILFTRCKQGPDYIRELPPLDEKTTPIKYAKVFAVSDNGDFKILTISNPWPESTKDYKYLI